MAEKDPLVLSYVHLASFPRAGEALHTLKKIASLVKPLMRARRWRVKELAEFYPNQTNLLGLNVNRGSKICIRLRYPGDRSQFLPMEQVVDTMLHELCHNVHGPHNEAFHRLWDQLRDEQQGLIMKGYTGEGFLSEGHRLGGARLPPHEARRLAREAAEKRSRQPTGTGPGRRLGGAAPRPGEDIRRVISNAAQRRTETLRGCAEGNLDDKEIHDLADTATRNGFRTKAEEDEANEVAIAQALWELVQEDEKVKNGSHEQMPPSSTQAPAITAAPAPDQRGLGRDAGNETTIAQRMWACGVCTCHNPSSYLCCNACGAERSQGQSSGRAAAAATPTPTTNGQAAKKREPVTIDLTESPSPTRSRPGKSRRTGAPLVTSTSIPQARETATAQPPTVPDVWQCSFCGSVMEKKWWTCSTCGRMKDRS